MADVVNMSEDEYRAYRRNQIRPNGGVVNDARATGYLTAAVNLALGSLNATVDTYEDEMPGGALRRIQEVIHDLQGVLEDVEGKPATA